MRNKNILLILALLAVVIISLNIGAKNGDLEGADGLAEEEIIEINKDYDPWFEPLWEPPSGEVESGIFALQAAIGGIILGYFIGVKKNAKNINELCQSKQTI